MTGKDNEKVSWVDCRAYFFISAVHNDFAVLKGHF